MTTETTVSKNLKKIEKLLIKMNDEEVLVSLYAHLGTRIALSFDLIQDKDSGVITGQSLVMMAGEKVIRSQPMPFDWPLQLMPMPDAFKGKLN